MSAYLFPSYTERQLVELLAAVCIMQDDNSIKLKTNCVTLAKKKKRKPEVNLILSDNMCFFYFLSTHKGFDDASRIFISFIYL